MCYVSFKNENNNNIVHNRFQVSGMIVHYCKQDIFVKYYLQKHLLRRSPVYYWLLSSTKIFKQAYMLKYPAWTFVVRVGGGTMAVDSETSLVVLQIKKITDENKTQIQKISRLSRRREKRWTWHLWTMRWNFDIKCKTLTYLYKDTFFIQIKTV